jgi:Mg-chelatase subunit ChlD
VPADAPIARTGRSAARTRRLHGPLRRRPKQLTAEPAVFRPGAGGNALVSAGSSRRGGAAGATGGTAPGLSDEQGKVIELADLDAAASGAGGLARRQAREIARRLSVARPRRDDRRRGVGGQLASVRWRAGSDDIDLDRTLDALAETPFPEDGDVVVRERRRIRRSVVLVVDVSGSMRGERMRTAAAAVGALVGELSRDRVAVVAFWSDAAVLLGLGEPVDPAGVLELLLRVPTEGLTNVAFALEVARRQLAGVPPRDARVLLLSDCVHNAGPDPRTVAAGLPRLDVLVDVSAEVDTDLGRDLAAAGRGRVRLIRTHRDVATAISELFADRR